MIIDRKLSSFLHKILCCGCSSNTHFISSSIVRYYPIEVFGDITYHKVPKFSDTRNSPKIQTKRQNLDVLCQKHANGTANREDPDQTAPLVCTVCPDLSVRKFRIIMVITNS